MESNSPGQRDYNRPVVDKMGNGPEKSVSRESLKAKAKPQTLLFGETLATVGGQMIEGYIGENR